MSKNANSLKTIFDGWDTYQTSIMHTVGGVSDKQLIFRPTALKRGELSLILGTQDIAVPELDDLGGHLTEPPLA